MRTMTTARLLVLAALAAVPSQASAQGQAPAPVATPAPAPPAAAQGATTNAAICGVTVGPPVNLPPAGSPPVIYLIAPCFSAQGNVSTVEANTYLFYMELARRPSQPSQNIWVPYDETAVQTIIADHKRLWATGWLDDLSITESDFVFANGVVGKLITYNMEERERVRTINYAGTDKINRTDIEEQLRTRRIEMGLDDFVDNATIARIKGVLREMMAEKGFTNAVVTHEVTEVAGGPKLVNVTFNTTEGPKIRIAEVEFIGNLVKSDATLRRRLKENKPRSFLSFITGGGTWQEAKFEADADLVQQYLQNQGYARARVGQPELITIREDAESRWVRVRIPVEEGPRYRVGEVAIAGNTVVNTPALRTLFDIEPGDWYNLKKVQEGFRKAQDIYGGGGYIEFTAFPQFRYSDAPDNPVPAALVGPQDEPTVDVTFQLTEGPQFLVNRITFVGNSTTRDNVIRRELRLVEGATFNMEALKYSVRRLNQLGYFEQIDEQDQQAIKYVKTPDRPNMFDVTLTLREQNRNQLTFGAGVSQYEGLFGQLSFQTANFMGRGESLTVSMQAGDRAQNYQLAFTEPFLFDRSITGGFDIYKRALQYVGYYTQKSTGGNLTFGFPLGIDFTRMFATYSYEAVKMTDLNEAFIDPSCVARLEGCGSIRLDDLSSINPDALESLRRNPFVFDSLLIGAGGKRTVSKITPSLVHNTVDNPIFPNTGKRFSASVDLAMLGGNTQFYKPSVEGIKFWRHTPRTSLGVRGQFQFIAPVGDTTSLPIFEKLFLGGEYSVRGFDIRSIGPSDPSTGLVLGGNKSLLFNGEYLISVGGPVRLILFYDAGQVADEREPFAMDRFKTSTGAEVRFMMPVLNVPFRLIFAANPQRADVFDNNLQPQKNFTFRFAVGSTF